MTLPIIEPQGKVLLKTGDGTYVEVEAQDIFYAMRKEIKHKDRFERTTFRASGGYFSRLFGLYGTAFKSGVWNSGAPLPSDIYERVAEVIEDYTDKNAPALTPKGKEHFEFIIKHLAKREKEIERSMRV